MQPSILAPALAASAITLWVIAFLPTQSHAFSTQDDCQLLKDMVADTGNAFKNFRSETYMKTEVSDEYHARQKFSSASRCTVIEGKKWFNENISCDLQNVDMPQAQQFVESCLGSSVKLSERYNLNHHKVFNFTSPVAGSVSLWRPGGDMHLTIDRSEKPAP